MKVALLAAVVILHAVEPTDQDWEWLNGARELAFERFMPLSEDPQAWVTYRSYRDLYQDVPERYLTIRGLGAGLEALLVQPVDASIQQQLLVLHIADRDATLPALLAKVKVRRRRFIASTCPAVQRQLDTLSKLKLPLPEREIIIIHPMVHSLLIDFGGGKLDARLLDDEHPAVRWASETIQRLERCAESQ